MPKPDASNRFSGNQDAIGFGEYLFQETALSVDGSVSCASCHFADHGFTDGRVTAIGLDTVDRNTLAIVNQSWNRWFGWDGQSDTLWAQSIHPILNPQEMGASADLVKDRILSDPLLRNQYTKLVGLDPSEQPAKDVLVTTGKALAAFQGTLTTPRTAFDDFRDALERDDKPAMAQYPLAAKRGLLIFAGKGKCSVCHFGPNFINGEFDNVAVPHFRDDKTVDPGRFGGIQAFFKSDLNRAGPYSDEPAEEAKQAPTLCKTEPCQLGGIQGAVTA